MFPRFEKPRTDTQRLIYERFMTPDNLAQVAHVTTRTVIEFYRGLQVHYIARKRLETCVEWATNGSLSGGIQ